MYYVKQSAFALVVFLSLSNSLWACPSWVKVDPKDTVRNKSQKERLAAICKKSGIEIHQNFGFFLLLDNDPLVFDPLVDSIENGLKINLEDTKIFLGIINKAFSDLYDSSMQYCREHPAREKIFMESLEKARIEHSLFENEMVGFIERIAPGYRGDFGLFVLKDETEFHSGTKHVTYESPIPWLLLPEFLEPYVVTEKVSWSEGWTSVDKYFQRGAAVTYQEGPYEGMKGYWELSFGVPQVWVIEGRGKESGRFEEYRYNYNKENRYMMCLDKRVDNGGGLESVGGECPIERVAVGEINNFIAPRFLEFQVSDGRSKGYIPSFDAIKDTWYGAYFSGLVGSPIEYRDPRDLRHVDICADGDPKFLYVPAIPYTWEYSKFTFDESPVNQTDGLSVEASSDYSQVEGDCGGELAGALDLSGALPFEPGLAMVNPGVACGPNGSGLWYGPSASLSDQHEGNTHQHFLCCEASAEGEADTVCQKENYMGVSRCVFALE